MEDPKLVEHTKEIFPGLTDEETEEATYKLRQYFDFISRLYKRIEADPEELAKLERLIAEEKERRQTQITPPKAE